VEPIGGFFGLDPVRGTPYYPDAMRLNTARNCLEYVLAARSYRKIYLPAYSCDVLFEPLDRLGIEWELYSIDASLDPVFERELGEDEAFLYINYFGVKGATVGQLAGRFGASLIVDSAQAFFDRPIAGIDTFYSPRKFFGVPDGAYLFTDGSIDASIDRDVSYQRMTHLVRRIDSGPEAAYADFQRAESSLMNQPILRMSRLTERLLSSIDYAGAAAARVRNFAYLDEALGQRNLLGSIRGGPGPLVYPFRSDDPNLRNRLITKKVFVATYWPGIGARTTGFEFERMLAEQIIPLPVDQRYGEDELLAIVRLLNGR
jgi:hypothetical protein